MKTIGALYNFSASMMEQGTYIAPKIGCEPKDISRKSNTSMITNRDKIFAQCIYGVQWLILYIRCIMGHINDKCISLLLHSYVS